MTYSYDHDCSDYTCSQSYMISDPCAGDGSTTISWPPQLTREEIRETVLEVLVERGLIKPTICPCCGKPLAGDVTE